MVPASPDPPLFLRPPSWRDSDVLAFFVPLTGKVVGRLDVRFARPPPVWQPAAPARDCCCLAGAAGCQGADLPRGEKCGGRVGPPATTPPPIFSLGPLSFFRPASSFAPWPWQGFPPPRQ